MDHYDDIQVEEFSFFDFVEEMNQGLFDEDEEDKTFNSFLNSNNDNWWNLLKSSALFTITPPTKLISNDSRYI